MKTEHAIDWRKTAAEIQDDFERVCKERDELAMIIALDTGTESAVAYVQQQRDDLLSICEELAESAEYWSEYFVPLGIVDRLNTAIARAKARHA